MNWKPQSNASKRFFFGRGRRGQKRRKPRKTKIIRQLILKQRPQKCQGRMFQNVRHLKNLKAMCTSFNLGLSLSQTKLGPI